jgi:hypothetical protein
MRGEEEKTVAGAVWVGNLASTRFEEGSGLCVKHPFSGDTADWVFQFQHWSPRNVTSHHNDCLTKRAVSARAVRKQARKYSLLLRPLSPWPPPPHMHNKIRGVLIFWWNSSARAFFLYCWENHEDFLPRRLWHIHHLISAHENRHMKKIVRSFGRKFIFVGVVSPQEKSRSFKKEF